MPTIALIREGSPVREHKNKYGQGITPHYLENSEVCSISFDSTLYTESQANEWLQSHDYKNYSLSEHEEPVETKENKRYLAVELSPGSDIRQMDGGLLVPDVVLLAPGTWTDSTQKQPCRYTQETLERYSQNWQDFSYWSRHAGGVPRDITDRIADIRNVRYQNGVTADLFFHGATTKSKDAIALVEAAAAGKIPWPYSSVEMTTRDKWVLSEKLFEAQEIVFSGAAMVNQGACRVCKIRNAEAPVIEDEPEPEIKEQEMADTKELETQIEQLKKELEEAKAKPEPKIEIPKELSDSIAALTESNKALSARLEKLENQPTEPATSQPTVKDLENLPEYFIPVNRKSGIIGA